MKDELIKLFETPNKLLEVSDIFFVEDVELKDELDLIELSLSKDGIEYQGIVMIKGLLYPIPKIGDKITINKIYLKYNQIFEFKVYVEGNVIQEKNTIKPEKSKNVFSFTNNDIFETLSKILDIKSINKSTIFIIQKVKGNEATVKSLSDSKEYSLEFSLYYLDMLKEKSFLWLNSYELHDNKIETSKLTTFEILDDEQLAKIMNIMDFNNLSIFKVIDVGKNFIVVMNVNYKIFNLDKTNNIIQKLKIECCTLIIISNFLIENDEIKLTNKSFIYKLKQELHYLDIRINSKAILKFYILDYNKNDNIFDTIINFDGDEKIVINSEEAYLIINNVYPKIYEYFPCQIGLINSLNKKIEPITFTIYIYNGLLNKLNVFINTKCPKRYFYEYLYYNITKPIEDIKKKINIDCKEYNIEAYDNFSSENRRRICLLNVPYQNIRTFEKELIYNSIQVNELILEEERAVVGINVIFPIEIKIPLPNSYFDEFYPDFGDVYDLIMNYNIANKSKVLNILSQKNKKLSKIKFEIDILNANYFEDTITLSQFKTWIGLIICDYMRSISMESSELVAIGKIAEIFNEILVMNVNHYDFIRIFIFLFSEKLINNNLSNVELQYISNLYKFSPYLLAHNFNIEQIKNLNEYNPLFQAYLQFDSFEAYNYIYRRNSYTFSLEMNFMIKYRLLSAYEGFFIIKRTSSEEYSYLDYKTKITVINEASIFYDNNFDIRTINNLIQGKNCAIPMVINFAHEKNGHFKFLLKNNFDSSPIIYFKGLRVEIEINVKKNGLIDGETGKIFENFICGESEIIQMLSKKFIYGELLESKYFNGNEEVLIKAVIEKNNSSVNEIKKETEGSPLLKIKKKNKFNILDMETLSELPRFYLHGCVMLDINSLKKELSISKERKKEIFKKTRNEIFNKYKKMDEIYENNKKLYEKYNNK